MVHAAGHSTCLNCGAPLLGPYCSQCGQHDVDYHRSLRFFAEDALENFLHFDGRFLITVRCLFVLPGFLTMEFLAGRRARYASPLRFYLLTSFLAFFAVSLAPVRITFAPNPGGSNHPAASWQALFRPEVLQSEEFATRLHHLLPGALFLCVPLLALLLKLAYARSHQFYVPHLIFALHLQAFFMLAILIETAGGWGLGLFSAAGATAFQHLISLFSLYVFYRALRRVYQQGRLITATKLMMVGISYGFIVAVATAVAVVLSAKLAT
ncbi:MAG TPA: DUF3667 domain-containing protein [Opitutaceae bacterium]|nr:DUF3667 domain-containing protein [Opitutaceae bacterium]